MQAQHLLTVQVRREALLHLRRRDQKQSIPGDHVIGEEVGQALAIQVGDCSTALVEQVHAEPAPFRMIPPDKTDMGIVQAILGDILTHPPQEGDLGAALVKRFPHLESQAKTLAGFCHAKRLVLATLAGESRFRQKGRTGNDRQSPAPGATRLQARHYSPPAVFFTGE